MKEETESLVILIIAFLFVGIIIISLANYILYVEQSKYIQGAKTVIEYVILVLLGGLII